MLAEEIFFEKLLAEEEKFREVVSRKENKKSTSRSIEKISCLKTRKLLNALYTVPILYKSDIFDVTLDMNEVSCAKKFLGKEEL